MSSSSSSDTSSSSRKRKREEEPIDPDFYKSLHEGDYCDISYHNPESNGSPAVLHRAIIVKSNRFSIVVRYLDSSEEEFKKRGEKLDKEKEAELKRLVDEGYNNPEKLAKDLADAFGIK